MLLGNVGHAVLQEPQVVGRLNGRVLELSAAHSFRALGTSEIRYGMSAAMEWDKSSGRLKINDSLVAQQSIYLRLFTSFSGSDSLNGIVAGVGARWIGVDGPLKNGYLEAGTGITLTDGLSIDINSHFNFASFVGGGYYFSDSPAATRVGIRWMHISNAGIHPPNRGINQLELVLGIRL